MKQVCCSLGTVPVFMLQTKVSLALDRVQAVLSCLLEDP